MKIADGAWLGYRKPLSGPGAWVARVGNSEGRGWEKTLWSADVGGLKADGEKVLDFWQPRPRCRGSRAERAAQTRRRPTPAR